MCFFTKFDLQLNFVALTSLRVGINLYLFVVGCVLAAHVHLRQAFGGSIIGLGAGLTILAFCNLLNTPLGYVGSRYHNKFLLSAYFCADLILMPLQFMVALFILLHTIPTYSFDFQNACMSHNLPEVDYSACTTYYKDDRTAAWKLVWLSYYEKAVGDSNTRYFNKMVTLQSNGLCCGFGRPFECQPDDRTFPSNLVKSGIDEEWRTQRILCGPELPFYPNTTKCEHQVDSTAVSSPIGGCYYDYTLGDCVSTGVATSSKGCASKLEETVTSWVAVQAYIAMGLTFFQLTSIFMACCMCWKKRDDDVLPGYMQEVPNDPYAKDKNDILIGSQIKTAHFKPQGPRKTKNKPIKKTDEGVTS